MRRIALSAPTPVARMSKVPNMLVVPLVTLSPGILSTGMDSPVMTD